MSDRVWAAIVGFVTAEQTYRMPVEYIRSRLAKAEHARVYRRPKAVRAARRKVRRQRAMGRK